MPVVEANGTSTYYEEYGEGKPLVFVHGANSDHQIGAEQLRPLSDEYRLIVYDLRGHGQTEAPTQESYPIDLYAEDLTALIDALELENPVVCGLSLGGMIGYRFAARYPDELSALVTVGAPTPRTFSLRERLYRVEFTKLITPLMGNRRVIEGITWAFEQLSSETESVDLDDIERIRESHPCENTETDPSERARMMRGVQAYIGSSVDWYRVDVPVLALYGENEPFAERHAEHVDSVLDRCRVAEIPDASHNSHVDNPEFIVERIRRFHAEHARPASAES